MNFTALQFCQRVTPILFSDLLAISFFMKSISVTFRWSKNRLIETNYANEWMKNIPKNVFSVFTNGKDSAYCDKEV